MKINDELEIEHLVTEADLAKTLSTDESDDFPAVLATSQMIALMELAAARLMQPLLAENQLSVGVDVNVTHSAATLVNETVQIKARYQGLQGKLYQFAVEVHDKGGSVGSGKHTRAIIETERLLKSANRRISQGQPS